MIGTILAIGIVVWLIVAGARWFFRLTTDVGPRTKPIDISCKQSTDGYSHVKGECYYPAMKKYIAEVVCQDLDFKWNLMADSQEELESKIRQEYDHCSQRIRDRINRRAMN